MATAKTALVTGATGFIGRHLTQHLTQSGWQVRAYQGDICDIERYPDAVDVVFHLAAVPMRAAQTLAPAELYRVNVGGTLAVLNYCAQHNATCLLASSAAVYGASPTQTPVTEDFPRQPLHAYGTSKLMAEVICEQQANALGLKVAALRIFNVYGPGQDEAYLIPALIQHAKQQTLLTLRTPNAYRDFIAIADVVTAFERVSTQLDAGFTALNVSSGIAAQVQDVVTLVGEVVGQAIPIEIADQTKSIAEASYMIGDNMRLQQYGWAPQFTLVQGLKTCAA